MGKVAVQIKNGIVFNYADENSAKLQATLKDWILVENDSSFDITEMYKWTVRTEDNKLVHVSNNKTSEEEKNAVITNLMLQNLQQANEITELKKISTTQALQSLQDAKYKDKQQKVITNQTVQILELQKNVSDIKSATNQ